MSPLASHPRHVLLAGLVGGLMAGPRVPPGPLLLVVALVAALPVLAAPGAARRRAAGLVAGALVLGVVGAAVAQQRLAAVERTTLTPSVGHAVNARATVLETPRPSPYGASALVALRGEPVLLRLPRAFAGAALPRTGDLVDVRGSLRAPSPFARARRAHAEWRARSVVATGLRRGGPAGAVDGVRRRAERALGQVLPAPEAALLRGMVLGDDAALPEDLRDAFRTAGLSHLVAASGANVLLLSALVLAIAAATGLGLRARWALVLAMIALYVPLAGGGPSIQRAGIMGVAGVVAVLASRPAARWYALGLAAAVTLGLDPRACTDVGWQLSFAAVAGLLTFARPLSGAIRARGLPAALAEAVSVTVAATLATAPLIAAHFGRVSLVSLPANVLAAPAVAPVMWLGMVAAAVGQVSTGAAAPLVALAGYPLGFLTWLGRAAAGVPFADLAVGPGAVLAAVVALGALGVGAGRAGMRLRRRAGAAIALAALAGVAFGPAVLAGQPPPGPPAGLRVSFLDVGQGDATLLQAGAASVLVDSGPPDGHVVERLGAAGVRRLDLLVVTHAEADHAGGAAAVLRALPVGTLLDGRDGVDTPEGRALGQGAAERRVRTVAPAAGQTLRVGGLLLRVLWPPPRAPGPHAGEDPNARAIVLEAEADGARVLLPADAESPVLAGLDLRRADVLKVAHHGSSDAGLAALLARVRPRIAVIEVGAGNTYGHPRPDTVAALRVVPQVRRTDRDGTVRVEHDRGGWRLWTTG